MLKLARLFANNAPAKSLAKTAAGLTTATAPPTETLSRHGADEPIDMPNPFVKEKQVCILCKHKITPSFKNVKLLSQFQSPYTGRIYGRHITGLCKQKQEEIEKAIIRAQNCALMPSYHKDVDFLKDPKLFDPEKPLRPHKY